MNVLIGPLPGFRYDELRQRKVWFNGVAGGFKDKLNDDPSKGVMFGDETPLPDDVASDCRKILEDECFTLQWRKSDVLLLDNMAVLHARRPLITLPRRVLASFCK